MATHTQPALCPSSPDACGPRGPVCWVHVSLCAVSFPPPLQIPAPSLNPTWALHPSYHPFPPWQLGWPGSRDTWTHLGHLRGSVDQVPDVAVQLFLAPLGHCLAPGAANHEAAGEAGMVGGAMGQGEGDMKAAGFIHIPLGPSLSPQCPSHTAHAPGPHTTRQTAEQTGPGIP